MTQLPRLVKICQIPMSLRTDMGTKYVSNLATFTQTQRQKTLNVQTLEFGCEEEKKRRRG